MFRQVKYYLMIQPEKAPRYLGHNPLQQLSYTGIYALALVEVVTGFALYGQSDPGGFFFRAFGWIGPLLGGMQVVRFVHHVCTLAVPDLHPHPRLPRHPGGSAGARRHHLLHHHRRTLRSGRGAVLG